MIRQVIVGAIAFSFAIGIPIASWYDDYDAGLNAVRKGQWQVVIQKMSAAISANPKENDIARAYGSIFYNYHPYYYRGVAYLNLAKYDKAVSDLDRATGIGEENLGSIDTLIHRAKSKLAAATTPEPQRPPPQPVVPQPQPERPVPTTRTGAAQGVVAHREATSPFPAMPVQMNEYVKLPVFFATNRNAAVHHKATFGAERGTLQYGLAWISIPRSHEPGQLEEPSIWTLTFREDPRKHVILLGVTRATRNHFYDVLGASIAAAKTNQAFVFIHGFNVTFADAARRTAQIKYDLGFVGPAILFSWPSYGETNSYVADEANAEWSVRHLERFLIELRQHTGATTIHIIAHSLGNRVLSRALQRIAMDAAIAPKPHFNQVVLVAPDMDAQVFREELAPQVHRLVQGLTLYGSNDDLAILASKKVHKNVRAGEGGPDLPIVNDVDSIDVTGLEASFLAHSYIAGVSVLGDVYEIICKAAPPTIRLGIVPRRPSGWKLEPTPGRRKLTPCARPMDGGGGGGPVVRPNPQNHTSKSCGAEPIILTWQASDARVLRLMEWESPFRPAAARLGILMSAVRRRCRNFSPQRQMLRRSDHSWAGESRIPGRTRGLETQKPSVSVT